MLDDPAPIPQNDLHNSRIASVGVKKPTDDPVNQVGPNLVFIEPVLWAVEIVLLEFLGEDCRQVFALQSSEVGAQETQSTENRRIRQVWPIRGGNQHDGQTAQIIGWVIQTLENGADDAIVNGSVVSPTPPAQRFDFFQNDHDGQNEQFTLSTLHFFRSELVNVVEQLIDLFVAATQKLTQQVGCLDPYHAAAQIREAGSLLQHASEFAEKGLDVKRLPHTCGSGHHHTETGPQIKAL